KRIFNESVWMEKNGHTIIIAAPRDTPLYSKAREHGFKVYPIAFKRLTIKKDYKQLKRIFYNEKPWVINTHGNKDSKLALFAAKKAGVPLRILSRHISAHVNNSWYNRILYKKLCHYIFTTAGYTTRHLKNVFKLNEMQIFSMPSGIIVPGHFIKKDEARKLIAGELGCDTDTRFIGFVGRVSKDKGVSFILEAFKKVQSRLPNYQIIIVGDGTDKYLSFLQQLALKLGLSNVVHFIGFKENVWSYYRAIDCKILPSVNKRGIPFEGVPQSLLEAMASKTPVIASKSGGIMDIIDHEKTGLMFNPEDAGGLAERLLQTIEQPDSTKKRVDAACEVVNQHHTIDAMGRDIIRIYRLHQVKLERSTYSVSH
ncbi:MAG: glycosyltransferase, partial [Desulfobacula sp.]|nr:glycosyltransferase [Desulfobacula sp.]